MKADGDGELTHRLDRLVQGDAPPLDVDAVLREVGGEVGLAHGAEEAPFVGGGADLGEAERLDRRRLALGLGLELGRRCVLAALDLLEVLEIGGGGVEGQLLGQEYVKRNFTPEAKAKMNQLIDNLIAALREDIPTLSWMGLTFSALALLTASLMLLARL